MSSTVKETAKQEIQHLKQLSQDGAKSGAYMYPLKGIFFYITHRSLWRPLLHRLAPTITLGTGVTTFMFLFTYLPQMAVMAFSSGPLAAFSAALLVLSESSTLTMVLSKMFLIEDSLVDTFDGTLVAKGHSDLVERKRQVKGSGAGDAIARLGKLVGKPFAKFTPQAIIRYFLYLPLNFIPVIGTIAFVALQGKKFGPNAHGRYYDLKNMNKTEREKWIDLHRGAYTSFGVPAVILEMVPIAGIFFAFTNTCGAALWAADLEQRQSASSQPKE